MSSGGIVIPNQMHGKVFENIVRASGRFSHAASDRKRTPDDRFDVGAEDDNEIGVPTSIVTTGGKNVYLSDARRFWESFMFAPYRILIGQYSQVNDRKYFHTIFEIIIQPEYKSAILGNVSQAEVDAFTKGSKALG